MQEKMAPWLMPIQDNLQFLMGDDKATLEMYVDKGKKLFHRLHLHHSPHDIHEVCQ